MIHRQPECLHDHLLVNLILCSFCSREGYGYTQGKSLDRVDSIACFVNTYQVDNNNLYPVVSVIHSLNWALVYY